MNFGEKVLTMPAINGCGVGDIICYVTKFSDYSRSCFEKERFAIFMIHDKNQVHLTYPHPHIINRNNRVKQMTARLFLTYQTYYILLPGNTGCYELTLENAMRNFAT
jgi:hypothetical protein